MPFGKPATLRQRGYYMTEADMGGREDLALAKCLRTARELESARFAVKQISDEIKALAEQLTKNPFILSLENYEWLSPGRLRLLIGDVEKAEQASAQARDAAALLQVTLPPMK